MSLEFPLKIQFFGPKELWKESTGELLCRSHPMLAVAVVESLAVAV